MRRISAQIVVAATPHDSETLWYDTERWPAWVDGLSEVERVAGGWPEVEGVVQWRSTPAGRGRVTERVVAYEPLSGQAAEVEDAAITGRQWVEFTPLDGGTLVSLTLEYELRKRNVTTPLVDLL